MRILIFTLFVLLFIAPINAQERTVTCDELAAIFGAENVSIDYSLPHGWDWDIDDMEHVHTLPFGNTGSIQEWREPTRKRRWLAFFFSNTVSGEPPGLHDLCMFRIVYD